MDMRHQRGHALKRLLIALLALTMPLAAAQGDEVTADQVVTALEGAYGVHPGEHRHHTKGTCALGALVGRSEAAA